jgi:hypothetical protein
MIVVPKDTHSIGTTISVAVLFSTLIANAFYVHSKIVDLNIILENTQSDLQAYYSAERDIAYTCRQEIDELKAQFRSKTRVAMVPVVQTKLVPKWADLNP